MIHIFGKMELEVEDGTLYYFHLSMIRMLTKTTVTNLFKTGYTIVLTGGELEEKNCKKVYDFLETRCTRESGFVKITTIDREGEFELFLETTISIRHLSAIHFGESQEEGFGYKVVLYLENVVHPNVFYFKNRESANGFYYQLRAMVNYETRVVEEKMKKLTLEEKKPERITLRIKAP